MSGAAATPGAPGFAVDLQHDPLQAQILLAHAWICTAAVANVGYFLLHLFFFLLHAPFPFLTNF